MILSFLAEADTNARRALLAASLGWMLDSMDIMLYAMVLTHLMRDLGMSPSTGGLLASVTLVSAALGGVVFGVIADRIGRTKALMISILLYSIFTAACGLAQGVGDLVVYRILLGLGMGGEWASGAALVAETWPSEHRGKALAFMQSSWAVGYAVAAAVTALVLPRFGWRAVFFVGVVPALITLWIRTSVREPEMWHHRSEAQPIWSSLAEIFRFPLRRHTLVLSTLNSAIMFAWWGLFLWIPSYLALPSSKGGAGLDIIDTSTWIILMQTGMWLGYVTFGFVSDRIGRKLVYVAYLFIAAALVPIYGATRDPSILLILGPFVAFFGTGHSSGFAIISAELFPTRVRATAQGFTYNIGRLGGAIAPFAVGAVAEAYGLGFAFFLTSGGYLFAALAALALPETRGREML